MCVVCCLLRVGSSLLVAGRCALIVVVCFVCLMCLLWFDVCCLLFVCVACCLLVSSCLLVVVRVVAVCWLLFVVHRLLLFVAC